MRPQPLYPLCTTQTYRSSEPPFATIHPNHPDLSVSFGQTTFNAEGQEVRGRFFSRVMHWPGGASGVTIGRGYDMGQRTPLQIVAELKHAGVPEPEARFLSGAAGLRGAAAERFVACNLSESPILSLPAQRRLFESVTASETIMDIKRILAKADLQAKYGAVTWEELTPMAQEVVFDLRYRGDYTPATRTRLQPLLVSRDDNGLAQLMSDRSFWAVRNVPRERVTARIEITRTNASLREAS